MTGASDGVGGSSARKQPHAEQLNAFRGKYAGNAICRPALMQTAYLSAVDILASAEDHVLLSVHNANVAMNIYGRQVSCTAASTRCLMAEGPEGKLL